MASYAKKPALKKEENHTFKSSEKLLFFYTLFPLFPEKYFYLHAVKRQIVFTIFRHILRFTSYIMQFLFFNKSLN